MKLLSDSTGSQKHDARPLRAWRPAAVALCVILAITSTGCLSRGNGSGGGLLGAKNEDKGLPQRYSIKSNQLVVLSDIKLGKHHPLVDELKVLRDQVHETLELPIDRDAEKVTIYLFSNETDYRNYLDNVYPGLPFRRAYFIGTSDKLAVYTFWGERIREDLRHEFTHGLLHASLRTVPLWLDEGLAEYFEVPGETPGTVNNEYAVRLAHAVQTGWRPDVHRLERLEKVEQMHRADYRESWAWVHFMLNGTPDGKQVLLDYLQELRKTDRPGKLSTSLVASLPEANTRFLNYVATLNTYRRWMSTGQRTESIAAETERQTVSRANAP